MIRGSFGWMDEWMKELFVVRGSFIVYFPDICRGRNASFFSVPGIGPGRSFSSLQLQEFDGGGVAAAL